MLDSLFAQPPSNSSLVWHSPHCTVSSPIAAIAIVIFLQHVQTIASCFAVVPRLCHSILFSQLCKYWNFIFYINIAHPSDYSHLCTHNCCTVPVIINDLLADRTIGRAFGTLCRLSSVTFCILAKWYVLAKNCLKE